MNWIQSTWMLLSGMSLTLGLVQAVAWLQRREAREHLVYAVFALSAAVGAAVELKMLMARSPGEYAQAMRLIHLGYGTALLCMPWFVYVRFHAGRRWLLYAATVLRLFVLSVSLFSAATINLSNLQLHQVLLPGGVWVAAPTGSFNPLVIPAHLNLVFMLAYFTDALVELRRRGQREEYRRGLRICGSMMLFILVSGGQTLAVTYGLANVPFLVTPGFALPILVLGYELGADQLRAHRATESESRLRESEEKWELAGQIAGIAPWSFDVAREQLQLSRHARQLFQIPGEGAARIEDWMSRIHPDDLERIRGEFQRSMASETSFERNYRTLLPDGTVRSIASRCRIDRDAAGKPVYLYGVSFDVTELRKADAMFRAALEAAPNAIFVVDAEGRIRLVNARACLMFGYTYAQLEELRLEALVPNWRVPPAASGDFAGLERRMHQRELHARSRSGASLPVELDLRPLEGGLLLASVSDISERRKAEQESAQQRTELAHLSRVAVLGEMSASLAHELNQPLTAIVSNAQAALRFLDAGAELQGELRDTLQDIAASGNRAGEVIRRLRAMLKKEEDERALVDVNQLIGDVLLLYRSDLINRGVSVRLELDLELPAVLGDRVQLQQVLLNLVINACDAMAAIAGERRLCVCSRRLPGNEVEFAVCDAGPGIAPERLEQVFEPFVTSKPTGMGLGLSVCKTIVKSHGGRIWASNLAGEGARFHVALAAADAQPAAQLAES